jgi:hypothetical protein
VEDAAGLGLKRIGCPLLEFLVQGLQDGEVNIICDAEIFNALSSFATFSRAEVATRSTLLNVRGFNPITGEVDVNVRWKFDVALCDGLEEGRMRRISKVIMMWRVGCNAIFARSKLSIASSIVENRACLTKAHPVHPYSQISIHPSQ